MLGLESQSLSAFVLRFPSPYCLVSFSFSSLHTTHPDHPPDQCCTTQKLLRPSDIEKTPLLCSLLSALFSLLSPRLSSLFSRLSSLFVFDMSCHDMTCHDMMMIIMMIIMVVSVGQALVLGYSYGKACQNQAVSCIS